MRLTRFLDSGQNGKPGRRVTGRYQLRQIALPQPDGSAFYIELSYTSYPSVQMDCQHSNNMQEAMALT